MNIVAVAKRRQAEAQDKEVTPTDASPASDPVEKDTDQDGDVPMAESQTNNEEQNIADEAMTENEDDDQLGSETDLRRRFLRPPEKLISLYQLCDIECFHIRNLMLDSPIGPQPQVRAPLRIDTVI